VTDSGQPFLTMEYLRGVALSDEIAELGRLSVMRTLHIFIQAAAAVSHAHQKSIIHRDLKPSNIMLITNDDDPDFVKIVDFGIAKILPQEGSDASLKLTAQGEVIGSPMYMSPEQCQGLKLDARSDIYSLGCCLYEALAGRPPHAGKNIMDTMLKQMQDKPDDIEDLDADPALAQRVRAILKRALQKDPRMRYQTMAEMKRDLETAEGLFKKETDIGTKARLVVNDTARRSVKRLLSIPPWLVAIVFLFGAFVYGANFFFSPLYRPGLDPTGAQRAFDLEPAAYFTPSQKFIQEYLDGRSDKDNPKANKESAQHYEAKKQLADGLYSSGQYARAIKAYREVVDVSEIFKDKLEPERLRAWVNRADCELHVGKLSDAIRHADRTRRKMEEKDFTELPDHVRALAILGECYNRMGRPSQAQYYYNFVYDFVYPALPHSYQDKEDQEGREKHLQKEKDHPFSDTKNADIFDAEKQMPQQMASVVTMLADFNLKRGNPQVAAELYEHARALWASQDQAYNVAVMHNQLGLALEGEADQKHNMHEDIEGDGKMISAQRQLEEAGNMMARIRGNRDLSVAKVMFNISDVLWKRGEHMEALRTRAQARAMWLSRSEHK